jgi:DNA-binding XRE family transcriptional regulator
MLIVSFLYVTKIKMLRRLHQFSRDEMAKYLQTVFIVDNENFNHCSLMAIALIYKNTLLRS